MFKKRIECDEMFNLLDFETADTFTSVNIPIEKLDYLKVGEFFTKKLQLQGRYFVVIHYKTFEAKMRKMKEILKSELILPLVLMKH